jgi:hypothetical protein
MAMVTLPDWAGNPRVVTKTDLDQVNAAILEVEGDAAAAQTTATSAGSAAATAQSTANTGVTNAATALGVAQQTSRWTLGSTTPGARHGVVLRRTTAQSVNSGADTPVTWQTADVNVGGMWSSGTNPEQITIQRAGVYLVACRIVWASNATNRRAVHLSVGGVGVGFFKTGDARVSTIVNDEAGWPQFSRAFLFAAGDVLRFEAWQNTGAALNIDPTTLGGTFASVEYLGPIV